MTLSSSPPASRVDSPPGGAAAQCAERRQKILRPYFPLLHDWLKHDLDLTRIPESVELEGRSVALGSWAQQQIKAFHSAPAFGLKADAELVLESIAFQFCALSLQHCLDRGPMPQPSDLPRFLDELVAQLSVGIALPQLLQNSIDGHVQCGKLQEARELSEFRSCVVNQVGALQERVGAVEIDHAERASRALLLAPVAKEIPGPMRPLAATRSRQLLVEQPDALPSWANFSEESGEKPGEKPDEKSSGKETHLPPWLHDELVQSSPGPPVAVTPSVRVKPMLILLALLLGVYALVMLPRLDRDLIPELTKRDFARFEAVRLISARPPSLYIVVDGDLWNGATPEAKLEMVEGMGVVAGQAGYTGIHVRSAEGRTVADWLKNKGATIRRLSQEAS